MTNTITVTFRAKRDEFGGGIGYRVPKLTPNHYSFAERDTVATLLATSRDIALSLKRYGVPLVGVVWEPTDTEGAAVREASFPGLYPESQGWTVTPRGNGFMADITGTFPLQRTA